MCHRHRFHLTKADATQFEALFGANEKVVGWLARIAKCPAQAPSFPWRLRGLPGPAFDPFAAPAGDDDFELFEDSAPADGAAAAAAAKPAPKKAAAKKDDDEEDFDLFGDTTEVRCPCCGGCLPPPSATKPLGQ